MGEVYRARDPRLGREVAIKVLPEDSTADPERLRRFELEARAVGALSHPNLLAVFDTGLHEGAPFVVFELLEGETLRARLDGRALPPPKALHFAIQIARGLAAAHQKGIVHRDLKPDNLFLTRDGQLKILDFGLAKLRPPFDPGDVNSETRTASVHTEAHMILGTVGYMSPEQVRRSPVDHRSDIFSFGSVLYEMLAGKRAFLGGTEAETMTAILNQDPQPLTEANGKVPVALERIVRHCLEKRPEDRFQSARDLVFDLESVSAASDAFSADGASALRPRRRVVPMLALLGGAVAVAGLSGGVLMWMRSSVSNPRVAGYHQITTDGAPKLRFLTDGARIYLTKREGGGFVLAQVSTVGGESSLIATPFSQPVLWDISPDYSHLLVGSWQTGPGPPGPHASLWVLPVLGGSPRRFGDVMAQDAAWSPDGKLISFAAGHDLNLVAVDGTQTRKLTSTSGWPSEIRWSPDGKRLRFTVEEPAKSSSSLWETTTDTGDSHPLLPGWNVPAGEWGGIWTADGRYFLFNAERSGKTQVWAIREKSGLLRPAGPPVQLTTGPIESWTGAVSSDGRKLYVVGSQTRGELVRYDLKTRQWVAYRQGLSAEGLDFSRDGTRVVCVSYPEGELWCSRADGGGRLQLTTAPMRAALPRLSPDASKIAFAGRRPGQPWQIYLVPTEGGSPEPVIRMDRDLIDATWSPDGRSLAIGGVAGPGHLEQRPTEIYLVDLNSRELQTLIGSQRLFALAGRPMEVSSSLSMRTTQS